MRERVGVLVVGAGIVSVVAVYVALNATASRDSARDLLPYQTLTRQLPDADQRLFRSLRDALLRAEEDRVRTASWPEPSALAARGLAPFTSEGEAAPYQWTRMQQGAIVNYFGHPRDSVRAGVAPGDPGTGARHAARYRPGRRGASPPVGWDAGAHVCVDAPVRRTDSRRVRRQPQNSGWTQVFTTPPNPAFYNRR